jgi:hypothetical protein
MAEPGRDHPALPIFLAAAAGACAYAAVFYPGAMGFDTAYQWWQARGGETTNIHGLGMTWLWRFANPFDAGPAPLFLLQLILFWAGAVLIAGTLRAGSFWRVAFLFASASMPVCFVLFSFVASDTMFMATLTCAFGLLLTSDHGGRRARIGAALALMGLAVLLRKNGAPAILPLLIYTLMRTDAPVHSGKITIARASALAIAAVAILGAATALLERTVDRRVTIFPATALWDLAVVSLMANEMLLPPASHGPGLALEDLRGAVVPYANTTLFERTQAGMRQPFLDSDDPLSDDVARAWVRMILDHPADYIAHRWRSACILFGSKQPDWPRELVYFDGEYSYDGNPPVAGNTSGAHARLLALFERLRSTALLAAWPYLVAAMFALVAAWRRRGDPQAQAALAVLASGLLYAAPLVVIAPSAELRYVGWTCLASILGCALALSSLRSAEGRRANGLTSSTSATTLRAP